MESLTRELGAEFKLEKKILRAGNKIWNDAIRTRDKIIDITGGISIISRRTDLSREEKAEKLRYLERKKDMLRNKLIALEEEIREVLYRNIQVEKKVEKIDDAFVAKEITTGFPSTDQRRKVHSSFGDWLSWKKNKVPA